MVIYELTNSWLIRLASFIWWSHMYLYSLRSSSESNLHERGNPREPEWCARSLSLLHGTIAASAGLWQCGVRTRCLKHFTCKMMPSHYALMYWSWGYFAFDLLWCLVYWTDALIMLFYHISVLAAITIYMQDGHSGSTFACTLFLMEITDPLLQMRWFLKKEGFEDTYFFGFIELVYLTLFLALRGVVGTYIIHRIFQIDAFCWEIKLVSLCFYIASIVLLYDIVGYTLYKRKWDINIGHQRFVKFFNVTNSITFNDWERKQTKEIKNLDILTKVSSKS